MSDTGDLEAASVTAAANAGANPLTAGARDDRGLAPLPGSSTVTDRLDDFTAVRSPLLHRTVTVLPWLSAAVFLLLLPLGDPMFLTGILAVGLAVVLIRALVDEIPEVMRRLWDRQLLLAPAAPSSVESRDSVQRPGSWLRIPRPEIWACVTSECALVPRYAAYLKRLQQVLNARASWLVGLLLAAIMSTTFSYRFADYLQIRKDPLSLVTGVLVLWLDLVRLHVWPVLASEAAQIAVAFVMGLLLWRLIGLAYGVHRLGTLFDVNVQLQHPDGCGGLRPVGNLCLLTAAVMSVASIYVGVWIILSQSPESPFHTYYRWAPFYSLLWPPFTIGAMLFLVPVYGIHRSMVRRRAQLRVELDQISVRMDELARMLLVSADQKEPARVEELSRQIGGLKLVYEAAAQIPVWPFDRRILQKFGTAQLIPLLTVTNLAPTIVGKIQEWLHT